MTALMMHRLIARQHIARLVQRPRRSIQTAGEAANPLPPVIQAAAVGTAVVVDIAAAVAATTAGRTRITS